MPDQSISAEVSGVHTIEWRIEPEHVWGQLRCTAPEGAECRLTCPMGCESWPCSHPLEDGGTCNPIEWIENSDGAVTAYGGQETALRDGPIEFNWEGDWYEWDYAP